MTTTIFSRLLAGFASGLILAAGSTHAADETARIGFQKSSTLTLIAKMRGMLAKALAPLGCRCNGLSSLREHRCWKQSTLGSVDVSADVADTVPVFAQATGAKLTYLALEAPSPEAQAMWWPRFADHETVGPQGQARCRDQGRRCSSAHHQSLADWTASGTVDKPDLSA